MDKIEVVELVPIATKEANENGPTKKYTMKQACRTCATFFNNTLELFSILDENVSEIATFKDNSGHLNVFDELIFLGLKVEKDDNLPQQICSECIQKLSNIHKFREQCEKSQITLKEYFSQKKSIPDCFKDIIGTFSKDFDDIKTEISFSENEDEENSRTKIYDMSEDQEKEVTEDGINKSDNEISTEYSKQLEEILVEYDDKNTLVEDIESTSSPSVIKCERCNKFSYSIRHKQICNNLIKRGKGNFADETEYICFYCDESFESEYNIKDHILKIHSLKEPFICSVCKETFPNLSERSVHMECHNDKDAFTCDICFKTFQRLGQLQSHKRGSHSGKPYECEKCCKRFTRSTGYRAHMKLIHESNKPHKCQYCEKTFLFPSIRKTHERVHTKEHPFKCDLCGKTFRISTEFKNHMRLHSGVKFICDICGKVFLAKSSLNNHKLTHKDMPSFQCEHCGKYFKLRSTLYSHRFVHTGRKQVKPKKIETPYKCPTCLKEFSLASSFEKHIKIHNEDWKFWCTQCGNAYKRSEQLKAHIDKIHLKKYWDCRYCQKKFTDFSIKDLHLKSHENDAYPCSYCGKSFKILSYLRIHERIHTGEKPCKCLVCGKRFLNHNFARHQKKHSTEEHRIAQERILANSLNS